MKSELDEIMMMYQEQPQRLQSGNRSPGTKKRHNFHNNDRNKCTSVIKGFSHAIKTGLSGQLPCICCVDMKIYLFQRLQRLPCIKPQRPEHLLGLWQAGFVSRSLRLNCVTCSLWRGISIVVIRVACSLGTQGRKLMSNATYPPLSDHPPLTQQVT